MSRLNVYLLLELDILVLSPVDLHDFIADEASEHHGQKADGDKRALCKFHYSFFLLCQGSTPWTWYCTYESTMCQRQF